MTLETLVSNIERAEYDWSDICAVKEPACESRLSPISRLAVQTSHDSTTQILTEENNKLNNNKYERKHTMNTETKIGIGSRVRNPDATQPKHPQGTDFPSLLVSEENKRMRTHKPFRR